MHNLSYYESYPGQIPLLLYFLTCGIKLAIKGKKLNRIFYGFLLTLTKRIVYVLGVSWKK